MTVDDVAGVSRGDRQIALRQRETVLHKHGNSMQERGIMVQPTWFEVITSSARGTTRRESHDAVIASIERASADDCLACLQMPERAREAFEKHLRPSLAVLRAVLQRLSQTVADHALPVDLVSAFYRAMPETPAVRVVLLQALAGWGSRSSGMTFAELLVNDGDLDGQAFAQALSAVIRSDGLDPTTIFPRLWDALEIPDRAVSVLDLANYLTRQGRVDDHPARARSRTLQNLLTQVASRLQQLETLGPPPDHDRGELARQVQEGAALCVALSHALGLLAETSATEALQQVAQLRHRPIRVAAAIALTRLDQPEGSRLLAELAAEPRVRSAVLAAAAELQITERIDPRFRSPLACAEARLIDYLTHPLRLGVPPTEYEVRDQRILHWPSYEQPVACYVFEYAVEFPQGTYRNLAVAGPVEATFKLDLRDWPAGQIYALAAGQTTEHAEMREWDYATAPPDIVAQVQHPFQLIAQQHPSTRFSPLKVAQFWDEWHLVVEADGNQFLARDANTEQGPEQGPGTLIVNARGSLHWYGRGDAQRPLEPSLAYALYKGQRLLEAFNDPHLLT